MKTTVLNCRIDLVDIQEGIDKVQEAIEEKKNFQIITLNPEMIMNAQKNKYFFDIINNSQLNIADGVGVRLALKFKNISRHQTRGIDFSRKLIELAAKKGYSLALLGASEEVIQKTRTNILIKYPNLNLVYTRNGYFDNENEIISQIKEKNPQILLAGLGSPKQEEIIYKLKNVLNGCAMIGVGGSFDVFSGNTKEAPKIFQKLGLEWLYRTICQPERFKRIFPALPIFLIKCIIDTVKKKDS